MMTVMVVVVMVVAMEVSCLAQHETSATNDHSCSW